MKTLISIASAIVVTRLGYHLVDFNPTHRFSFWPGLLVDFGIYLTVYVICDFAIGEVARRLRQ